MDSTDLPPRLIDKYEIQGALGSGAMGVVYKAYDSQIERTVAIKVLHDHLRKGEHGRDLEIRFLQEAKAAARCQHPNIVAIFDFGSNGTPYIAMEYVEGIELSAYLKSETSIALPSATDITIQTLKALGHAHENGVVHRDIKPSNIILLENGNIKVSDFGVARLDTSDLTSTGFMVGTPNYMSPEALLGQQVDKRSDLYSVGVLFYQLLTRSIPARDKSLDESLARLEQVEHLSAQNVNSIKPIIRRALQASAADRYQSTAEFITQLESIDDMDLTLAMTAQFPAPSNYDSNARTAIDSSSDSQWNDKLLSTLEQSLARHVGPVAKFLVKKNSSSSTNIDELVDSLLRHIPDEGERSQFVRSVRKESTGHHPSPSRYTGEAPASEGSLNRPRQVVSEAQLKALTSILAFYTGPLASRLIKRGSAKHTDFEQLVSALAQHISNEDDRQKFLNESRKLR